MNSPAEVAKFNMIEQQMRPWEVLDTQVLAVVDEIDRQDFVPEAYRGLAYADCQIPIGGNASMLPPTIEGRMLQALLIDNDDDILEIGSGSGYLGACLARLGRQVHSLDLNAECQELAKKNTEAYQISNIEYQLMDPLESNYDQTYDVIAVTGSVPSIPVNFEQALKTGGRMFIVVGHAPAMRATLVTRAGANEWIRQSLFETDIPALVR